MKTLKGNEITDNPRITEPNVEEILWGSCDLCGEEIKDCGICDESLLEADEIYCDVKGIIDHETGADLHFHKHCFKSSSIKLSDKKGEN